MKELHLILLLSAIIICFIQYNSVNYTSYAQVQTLQSRESQAQQTSPSFEPALSVKITSPSNGQNVTTGQLTISGTSTDTGTRDCEVYADWNDRKPFQRVVAVGPEGNSDYSRWNYTYTADYHEITTGTNELTSKISCLAIPTNLTKWYSINVTGVEGQSPLANDPSRSAGQEQGNSMFNLNNNSSPISTISTAEIIAPGHGSSADLEGSEGRSETDNKDVDDEGREDGDEEDEENGGENDFDFIENNHDNNDANNGNHNNDDANNGNTEHFSTNEDNREEDKEEDTLKNDLEDSDQNEDESQESLSEDENSINSSLEGFGDSGKYEDKERSGGEESKLDSPFDIPFEVSIPTIPSIPSLPMPDLDDVVQREDDNCDIGDAGFPFCDGQQLDEKSIDNYDNDDDCDIGDAGFPFCDGRED